MKTYDAIVVLGSQPDPATWKFPPHIYDCLKQTKRLVEDETAPYIITAGKWSIALDNNGIVQPFSECDLAANYLKLLGVPDNKVLRENESKDSISNLYFLKTRLFIPRNMKQILFVVAEFRIPRLQFLCDKILGDAYEVSFEAVTADVSPSYDEPHTHRIQAEFLAPMKMGDHEWLADKFYTAPMYHYWAAYDKKV